MTPRWLTLGVRPPARPDDRVEVLRFLRDLMIRSLLLSVVGGTLVVAIVGSSTANIIVVVVVVLTALDALFLNWQLRREQLK